MNAQELYDFLTYLKNNQKIDLQKVSVNIRNNNGDDDITEAKEVYEDLFDTDTNSILETILIEN